MQAQRRGVHCQRLRVAQLATGEIRGVAADRKTQVRAVDANLVRASGQRPRFQQRRAVGDSSAMGAAQEKISSRGRPCTRTRYNFFTAPRANCGCNFPAK